MSGYVPYGPGSCSAQKLNSFPLQNIGSSPCNGDPVRQRQLTGHRRQRPDLIGYNFPEHKPDGEAEREAERKPEHKPQQSSLQELLKNAGPDDGPYPWFSRPVPRIDYWAESNVDRWDPYHPQYAGNNENRKLPSIELPPAVSPISSFQLLGMTGSVASSQDSQEEPSSQGRDTRASSSVNVPILASPGTGSKTRAIAAFHDDRLRTRKCCFFFYPSHKKATRIIYSSMGIMIVSIIISAVIYNTTQVEGSMKIAILTWLGGSVLILVLLLIYNNARAGRLQEWGRSSGYNKDWVELADMIDSLSAPSRVHLHDNGVVYRAHAGGQLPSLTNVSTTVPGPPDTASKSKPKSKTSTNALESNRATRGGCGMPGLLGLLGSSRSSTESQKSVRSTSTSKSTQYCDANGIGIARSDSLCREEEMVKTMKDRQAMLQKQEAQSADISATLVAGSDSEDSINKASSTVQQGLASLTNFSLPEPCRPRNKSEWGYGSGLPPRDTWCREPCGSMSNLREDYYGNENPGSSYAASPGIANGGVIPKRSSSLAARFNELTPISERSYEGLTPCSLLLSPRSPSRSRGTILSSPPSAHIPYMGSNFF
ncbi:uncharacterized protein GGS22DRAFT_198407 [Annulohypoxylon maeteangense]|uniref:uncharacterized protein n=1 Tax=Annulohypoxylon maeteangense TaxID=1927788 RepID=UPI002008D905|nr:uncharacterized protein GGS22DRAFT_198407 [Annulohypoxylon maeteangense]KAI0879993.1 hypothetical protein GGS22DRAFT_198407 [Annulohypoxylon maeteangense]